MKGLILSCMDRDREEAYECCRRGLRNSLTSANCTLLPTRHVDGCAMVSFVPRGSLGWHVMGVLYRADRDYQNSVKCFKNALRMDRVRLVLLTKRSGGFLAGG